MDTLIDILVNLIPSSLSADMNSASSCGRTLIPEGADIVDLLFMGYDSRRGACRRPISAVSPAKMQCFRFGPLLLRPLKSPAASKVFTRLYATPVTIGTLSPAPNSTHNVCSALKKKLHLPPLTFLLHTAKTTGSRARVW